MPRITLKGLAWRHRRATEPLAHANREFTAQHPEVTVEWSVQPLSGFEFAPVGELAKTYDFMVLDHPFCAEGGHDPTSSTLFHPLRFFRML